MNNLCSALRRRSKNHPNPDPNSESEYSQKELDGWYHPGPPRVVLPGVVGGTTLSLPVQELSNDWSHLHFGNEIQIYFFK
jgi:hypothetical protein